MCVQNEWNGDIAFLHERPDVPTGNSVSWTELNRITCICCTPGRCLFIFHRMNRWTGKCWYHLVPVSFPAMPKSAAVEVAQWLLSKDSWGSSAHLDINYITVSQYVFILYESPHLFASLIDMWHCPQWPQRYKYHSLNSLTEFPRVNRFVQSPAVRWSYRLPPQETQFTLNTRSVPVKHLALFFEKSELK